MSTFLHYIYLRQIKSLLVPVVFSLSLKHGPVYRGLKEVKGRKKQIEASLFQLWPECGNFGWKMLCLP